MDHDGAAGLAVVTGASSGIGLELARQFARHGHHLVINAEDPAILTVGETLSREVDHRIRVQAVQADLGTPAGVEELVAAVRATGRPVDALALNAGIGVGGPFVRTPLEDDLRLVQVNIASVVHLAKRLVPEMVETGSGRVLFTSSVASSMPGPYFATYAASKAFVQSFAEALRYEVKDSGVTVTSLMPGPTDTDFFARAGMQDTPVGASDSKDDPAEVAREGFEALMAGKDHVVAGSAKNRLQKATARVLPERARAAAHARQTEPREHPEPDTAGDDTR